MNDIEATPQPPDPNQPPTDQTEPVPAGNGPRYPLLDGLVLFGLLALCAGVYRAVGDGGFSVISAAVTGLYGTWRLRR
ncbi:hypothetical protein B0675_39285 [Streptomyces sp. M41(2017)]|uniref:hypothetical protein n=1 Tax=Streptomyces sp. M41(2017) TaxID=1955065 RepID=UPI0009C1A0BD|nr:hypothetical protein [Streptomyces sp. M41(2017)]OQQ13078.1 hypothetical protein B0675_39285 [Streptomyces sp. M41(2017)]